MTESGNALDSIRERLAALEAITPAIRRDFDLEVPPTAAVLRDWEPGQWLQPPLHPNELSAIESSLAAPLPEDFRAVVSQLANGMIGPGQGIRSLVMRSILSSSQRLRRRWSIETPLFPDFTRNYDRSIKRCGDGALVVSELRAAAVYILVLTGRERGAIWYDDSANSGVVAPIVVDEAGHLIEVANLDLSRGQDVLRQFELMAATGRRASFSQWYAGWLDKVIAATRARFS